METNNDLKDKLEISNENYNRVINEQKELEIKMNNLVDTLNNYQKMYKNFNNKNVNKNLNNSVSSYSYSYNYNYNKRPLKHLDYSNISNKSFRNYYPYRSNYISNNFKRNCKSPVFMNKRSLHKYIYNNNNF